MAGLGQILLVVAALVAVALIAWILAFGVESGVEERRNRIDPESEEDETPD